MEINITIKEGSIAEKAMEEYQAQKEAFKKFVQSGKAAEIVRAKQDKIAPTPVYH